MKRNVVLLFALFCLMLFVVLPVLAEDEEEPEVYCENEAGHCTISRWGHECLCRTVNGYAQANGGGGIHGDYEVSEEVCKSDLESNCGKEKPTVRSKCGKKFDFCVTYVSESSRCTDNHMSEDDVIAAVDNEDAWNDTKQAVYYGWWGGAHGPPRSSPPPPPAATPPPPPPYRERIRNWGCLETPP